MLRRTRYDDDDGLALVLVLGIVGVLTLLVLLSLQTGVRGMERARQDQSYVAALPAAQAGVEDYLHHLNVDNNYFSKENGDAANPAFSGWVTVPGSPTDAAFRYRVLTPAATTVSTGSIRLRVSGRVRDRVRTIEVTIRKRGFLDYLYFTDKETTDPERYPELLGASVADAAKQCDQYYPNRGSVRVPFDVNNDHVVDAQDLYPCADIQFGSEDRLDGPVGSNDAFLMKGTPSFSDVVTTGWTDPENKSGGNNFRAVDWNYVATVPAFAKGKPQPGIVYPLPPANTEIRSEADSAQGGTGCLYTGPTRIRLLPAGKMEVTSPYTRSTNAGCGSGFSDWQDEGKDIKQAKKNDDVPLPTNGVVYVQPIPNDPHDPNYSAVGTEAGEACPTGSLLDGKFPDAKEWFPAAYSCRSGDTWVEGSLRGQLTIAAANDVYITDDLTYDKSGSDSVLGLIANNNVKVHHPVECTDQNEAGTCFAWRDLHGKNRKITIEAAILALQHSFTVQNYQLGELQGDLTVNGAIVQHFRGAVRQTLKLGGTEIVTGYAKDYHYDRRLQYLQPPFFLSPTATSWSVRSFSEQRPSDVP